jgi:hypothetical protein
MTFDINLTEMPPAQGEGTAADLLASDPDDWTNELGDGEANNNLSNYMSWTFENDNDYVVYYFAVAKTFVVGYTMDATADEPVYSKMGGQGGLAMFGQE